MTTGRGEATPSPRRPVTAQFERCDTGEVVTLELPRCPDCGSTAKRCIRPSGHSATEWHVAREEALRPLIGCTCGLQSTPPPTLF